MRSSPCPWDDEANVNDLKRLWADGRSGGEIAKLIGGTTRNSIIGKVYRLKLAKRPRPATKTASGGGGQVLKMMTPEQIAEFKAVFASGVSVPKIKEQFSMSPNSVRRVARLLGLPARKYSKARARRHADKGTYRGGVHSKRLHGALRTAAGLMPVPVPTCEPVTLLASRPWHCTWIAGEVNGPATFYCGAPRERGSWCGYHDHIGRTPIGQRQMVAA